LLAATGAAHVLLAVQSESEMTVLKYEGIRSKGIGAALKHQ
jgi:hypothetical protein